MKYRILKKEGEIVEIDNNKSMETFLGTIYPNIPISNYLLENGWIEEVPSQQIENFGTIDYWEEKFKQRLSPNYEIWSLPIQYYYNIIIAAKHLGMKTILFSSDCPHVRIAFDGLYKEG